MAAFKEYAVYLWLRISLQLCDWGAETPQGVAGEPVGLFGQEEQCSLLLS